MLPLPTAPSSWALFLDFDGTLTEIAATPDAVKIHQDLPALLQQLSAAMDGALAIVSGRGISQIDAFLAPARLAVAGLHGLETRKAEEGIKQIDRHRPELEDVKQAMAGLVAGDSRLLLEDKQLTVALHFRNAPDRAEDCRKTVQSVISARPALELLEGKMVLEARPCGMNKGKAIQAFMQASPFRGRRPVMVGDDVTDEDGFKVVNDLQGLTIKVGPGPTSARHRLATVGDVLIWLKQMRDTFGSVA